jgi:hypothetical protein
MLFTIVSFHYPGLPGAVSVALQALLLTVAMLAALALVVAVCMAVVGGYAMLTMPQAKAVRA